jgi:hypothetical protein
VVGALKNLSLASDKKETDGDGSSSENQDLGEQPSDKNRKLDEGDNEEGGQQTTIKEYSAETRLYHARYDEVSASINHISSRIH